MFWTYTCRHTESLTSLNCLYGTNWTMSLATDSPTVDLSTPSSPSRSSMALKSAGPTPTIMIDSGSREARTMASRVWSKSVISPSVRMRRTQYCCREPRTQIKVWVWAFCHFVCVWCVVNVCPHSCAVGLCSCGCNGCDVIDEGREVCWSRESQLRQSHPVGFNYPLNTWEKQRGNISATVRSWTDPGQCGREELISLQTKVWIKIPVVPWEM